MLGIAMVLVQTALSFPLLLKAFNPRARKLRLKGIRELSEYRYSGFNPLPQRNVT